MDDKSVDCVITDPPYGIDYQSAHRIEIDKWKPKIANDKKPFVKWIKDAFRILKPTGRLICFYRWDVQEAFLAEIIRTKFNVKSQIVWDKIVHGSGDLKGAFAPQHESIIYATKGKYQFQEKRPTSIIQCMRVFPDKLIHPNEKPVLLMQELISPITKEGDTILDPFMGSGTTGVAAQRLGRDFIGIELSPEYCDMARDRIKNDQPLFTEVTND